MSHPRESWDPQYLIIANNKLIILYQAVKHGKITKVIEEDMTMYKFGEVLFQSLVLLVEHYQKNPFYKGQTLREPISRELLHRLISQPLEHRDNDEYVDHSTGMYS